MSHRFAILLFLILLPCLKLRAEEAPAAATQPADFVEITPKQEEAVERGLAWLAKTQNKDGSWASHGATGNYQMAMTGLAGLAFLSAGHSPGRGKYGATVTRAMVLLLLGI